MKLSVLSSTGYLVFETYRYKDLPAGRTLQSALDEFGRPLYFKTHFPFIESQSSVGAELNSQPDRVVVVIRHPFDAGFSEYVRSVISWLIFQPKKFLPLKLSIDCFSLVESLGLLPIVFYFLVLLNTGLIAINLIIQPSSRITC